MAQDSEDRLKKIMEKLYRKPRPRISALSPAGGEDVTASKGISVPRLAPRAQVRKAQPCRPWNRSDLFRRLATFKAMTWFGKPKDISPVNCARRGWINVEMDAILCEGCGSRLLFSTPPSWSLQQVEKAAAVFSLKLDNGHKLSCPWINNVCDESLASFPLSTPQALVEEFKERSHALWRLTTLPVISSLTINYMKSPQFDQFLSASVHPSITWNNGVSLIDDYRRDQDSATDADLSHGYYQALNIISICGWEPRALPYTIDIEDQFDSSSNVTDLLEPLEQITHEMQIIPSSINHNVGGRKDIHPGEYMCDQSSTVLECRFCGACVGLWLFNIIPHPLEFFKVSVDGNPQSDADVAEGVEASINKRFDRDHTSNIETPSSLHMSIAGGPPPNKQHFRPKLSFSVVSRHLRAELLYDSCLRYQQDISRKEDHHDGSKAGRLFKRKQCELEGSNSQLHVGGQHVDVDNVHTTEQILTQCNKIIRDVVPSQSGFPTSDARESNDSDLRLDESNCGHRPKNDLIGQCSSECTALEILTSCTDVVVRDAVPCQSDPPTTDAREPNDSVSRLDLANVSNSQLHTGDQHSDLENVLAGESRSKLTTEETLTPCTDMIVRCAFPCQSSSLTTDDRESNDSVLRLDKSSYCHTSENDLAGQGKSESIAVEILCSCSDVVVTDAISFRSDSPATHPRESNDSTSKLHLLDGSSPQLHVGGHHGDVGNILAGAGQNEHVTEEIPTSYTNIVVRDAVPCQNGSPTTYARESNDLVSRLDESHCRHTIENNYCGPSVSRFAESNYVGALSQTAEQASVGKEVSIGFGKEVSVSFTRGESVDHLSGNLRPRSLSDFDPIKQHRPFCPWISEGKTLPGWKVVLSALNILQNNNSQHPEPKAAGSSFLDEIDDPIVSIRKLFMSPPSKRFKVNQ